MSVFQDFWQALYLPRANRHENILAFLVLRNSTLIEFVRQRALFETVL